MAERRGLALTERVIINFSREQLERLDEYLHRYGENRGGFIRRVTLEKLTELGFGLNQKRTLRDLVQETRGHVKA